MTNRLSIYSLVIGTWMPVWRGLISDYWNQSITTDDCRVGVTNQLRRQDLLAEGNVIWIQEKFYLFKDDIFVELSLTDSVIQSILRDIL